jgi:cation-transporting ATPase 13A3/4/5
MNYEYKLEKNEIIPVYLDLSKMTNKTVINLFSEGISSKNLAEKIEERYGKNEYYINPNLLTLYFKKVQAPTFLIIIFIGIGEIILNDYSSFIIKLTFISFIIIIEFIYSKYTAYCIYKKENTIDGENKIKVKRKYLNNDKSDLYYEINNRDLLPGDILYLKTKDMVPCDCLLLEGECIVNQNHLNGNLGLLKKISIINNNERFNYKLNNNNILLHGMKIIKIFSKIKEQYISALCINTGPNT